MSLLAATDPAAVVPDVAIPLIRRPDVELIPRRGGGVRIRDPLTLRHFELTDSEHSLWSLLDGRRGFRQIREEFERRQAPLRLSREQFDRFVAIQHAQGLVVSTGPGQARILNRRSEESRRKAAWSRWLNPLALRCGGIDPQAALDATRGLWGLIFNQWTLFASFSFLGVTLLFAAARATEIAARLPDLAELARPEFVAGVLVMTAVVKVLHELAHLCVCRKLGGECHDAGLLFLVGLPCLYCDVSDAWRFPRRRDRIAVSLAGVWIELTLAAVAFWVWWRAVPGPVSLAALQLMVVCSVSTLAFNLNPLLKYDGYYALADLIDIPNLGERSLAALKSLPRWLTGAPPAESFGPLGRVGETNSLERWSVTAGLALFGLASLVYRTVLTAIILLTIYRVSREWRVEAIGLGLIGLVAGGVIVRTVHGGKTWWKTTARLPHRRIETGISLLLGGAVVALLLYPFPRWVSGTARLEPAHAERLYVTAPGRLILAAREGDMVRPGMEIARLDNPELAWALEQLRGELSLARTAVKTLERRQSDDPAASRDLPAARERVRSLETQVATREADVTRLRIVACQAGRLWAGEYRPHLPAEEGELTDWTATPLSPDSAGAWLETGTVIGWVATGDEWDAIADLPQSDVELIAEGARARVLVDTGGGEILAGRIESIARLTHEQTSPASVTPTGSPAPPPAGTSPTGTPAPYEVRVRLDDRPRTPVSLRSSARLRIEAGRAAWLARAWREILRVLRFESA